MRFYYALIFIESHPGGTQRNIEDARDQIKSAKSKTDILIKTLSGLHNEIKYWQLEREGK